MSNDRFRVQAAALNLRSEPVVEARTRLAVLPEGQTVTRKGGGPADTWWQVATELQGLPVEGWVASRFLVSATEFRELEVARGIAAVHLRENDPAVRRDVDGRRAFPLGEPGRPRRAASTPEGRTRELGEIIDWLRVEASARYLPVGTTTFCNIYAHDYCYLAGAYLPRVWWTPGALLELARGRGLSPRYGDTVNELNANMLLQWLVDFGPGFDWRRTMSLTELQEAANRGAVALICAQRANLNRPGHIAAVAPETGTEKAVREGTTVIRPLQSQAGSQCFRRGPGSHSWWARSGPAGFGAFGLWFHD